jgi:DNA-binding transcriptional LysR family regulator
LRVSAPLLFSQIAMGTLASRFAMRFPDVRLEVTTEDRAVDMVEEGYDVVIRVNPDPDESLVGRIFLRDRLVVVAAPGLGRPTEGQKIPAVTRGGRGGSDTWTICAGSGETTLDIGPVLGLSSLIMVRDAVRAGVGVAKVPLSLVTHDLAAGSLVLWGDVKGPDIELWLLYPSRRLLSARVAAFLEFFREAFPSGTPQELAAYMSR